MSWFQTGLSSLTGQIGNFTREVLTEGTEEIEGLRINLAGRKIRYIFRGKHTGLP